MNLKFLFSSNNKPNWAEIEYFNKGWEKRILQMSKLIKEEKNIMDLGCGKMWLKKYLNPDIHYYCCDYKKRDENTIICDFNKNEYPAVFVDLSFVSGTFEYIIDVESFIRSMKKYSSSVILSYVTKDHVKNLKFREKQAWKNHFFRDELISLFNKHDFLLTDTDSSVKNNDIFKFNTYEGQD